MPYKTIFISSFFGLIARNILSTSFLETLRNTGNLRVVIFVPEEKKAFYGTLFGNDNVIIEGISVNKPTRLELFMNSIFLNSSNTSSRKIHRMVEFKKNSSFIRYFFHGLLAKLSLWKFYRLFLRYGSYRFLRRNVFKKYFEKYRPELVFITDIFEPDDVELAREAKSEGVFVLGMVRSWDNITTKGLNHLVTDKLVVNTPRIKEEAVKYCDFREEDICVVGVPHYDAYVAEPRTSKGMFFRSLNLDPNKKTVFFAAPSEIYAQGDTITPKIVELLMPLNLQIIVRLYIVGKTELGDIKQIPGKLAIDDPGSLADFVQADLTGKDAHLADLLYHSDVILAFASTLAVDAVVFNKPVIFIGFDGLKNRPYWQSLRRFYDYDHQRSIIETRGVRLARTPAQLMEYLGKYLDNPSLDLKGRQRIVEERCWRLDGQSGTRLADVVLKFLSG